MKRLDYFVLIFWFSLILLIFSIFFVKISGFLITLGGILLLFSLLITLIPRFPFDLFEELLEFFIFYRDLIKNLFYYVIKKIRLLKKLLSKKQIKELIKVIIKRLKSFPKNFIKSLLNIIRFYKEIIKDLLLKKQKRALKIFLIIIIAVFLVLLLFNLIRYIIKAGISMIGISFLFLTILFLIFMTILITRYHRTMSLKQIKERKKTIAHRIVFSVFVAYVSIVLIAFKRNILVAKFTLYFIIIGSIITVVLIILFTRFYSIYKPKELKKKRGFKLISIEFRKGRYTTDIDLLYQLIKTNDCVPLSYAVKVIKVDKKRIEEWAKILEDHNLITINYPAWGEPELCKK